MTEARHRLFLASAGTGKTFQLTSHLLGLLFRGADPGRLLPTTFTRKAAGEILERVLERVVEAAESEAKRAELSRAVGLDLDEAACRKLLVDLASKLDRCRVGPRDAFFVRLGQLFAFDLGLPPTWRIADPLEEARHKREAIARVLAEDNREELVELLRGLQRGGGGRSLVKAVERVVDEASAMYRESTPEAWTRLEPPPAIEEEELAIAVRNLLAFQPPTNKGNGEPKKHWVNNLAALAELLEAGDWKGLLKNNLVQKVLAGEDSFDRAPISDAFRDILSPLIEQARHEQIVELKRRTEASFALLERYEQALAAVKHERASYGFGDLPRALAPAGPGDQGPFARREIDVAFRLDGQIDHLLLDEFQDTSPLQWRVLEPLAEEILSEHTGERSFFCVGDLKQSIYGWREAEPRLLSEMEERYPVLEREALNDSYRSSHVCWTPCTGSSIASARRASSSATGSGGARRSAGARATPGTRRRRTFPARRCSCRPGPRRKGRNPGSRCSTPSPGGWLRSPTRPRRRALASSCAPTSPSPGFSTACSRRGSGPAARGATSSPTRRRSCT